MKTFVWDSNFTTGLETVDAQHHHLVELINRLGASLIAGDQDEAALDAVFGDLAAYARYHFAEEEGLMSALAVDARHQESHRRHHAQFIDQVSSMWTARHTVANPAEVLHGFLAAWLGYHILGEDQDMARQIARIRAGETPAAAFDHARLAVDHGTAALLAALGNLYHVLAEQNRDLAAANLHLEERVAERTRELARKVDELQTMRDELLQSEKMASLGRMVAGFAHEVNTPVGVAVGAASHIEEALAAIRTLLAAEEVSEEQLLAQLQTIEQACGLTMSNLRRAARLVQSFKRTSVDQASESSRDYRMAELIDDVIHGLHAVFKRTAIRFEVDCPADLELYGPPGAVEQILTNLAMNSYQHGYDDGSRGGVIRIAVSVAADGWVRLSYADDGRGMAPDVAARVFEPFFTTRRAKGGSGLGLYIAYNLATQTLGGAISCHSEAGRGARFDLDFPLRVGDGPAAACEDAEP
ncbi:MAG: bacteriohemerythrin [Rhodocyclaceae bacterium]|nr:bacteriohemerythrin [Rhodocyclaceae bacterium]